MGYRPDPVLRALSQYRRATSVKPVTQVLAWLNAWADPEALRGHGEFDAYWHGASAAAVEMGCRLEEFQPGPGLPPDRLKKVLHARGIRGLIIPPHPAQIDWGGFSFGDFRAVRIGYSQENPPVHRITSDQHGQPLKDRLPPLELDSASPERNAEALAKWAQRHAPDGILSDLRDSRHLCRAAGLQVSGDVSMAVLSVRDGGGNAGIDQHAEAIGRAAAEWVLPGLHITKHSAPLQLTTAVGGSWKDGEDCPHR